MRIARPLLVVLGVVACAWFALGVRQAHDIDRVTSLVAGLNGQNRLTALQAATADSQLDAAATLNPDRMVDVLRARVALLRNDRPAAKRILLGVVADEPDNLDAWYGLATSASDGPTVNRAFSEIGTLLHTPKK